MPINYDQLAAGSEVPADGEHTARLEKAKLVETRDGSSTRLVTEWSDSSNVWWQTWNQFEGQGLPFTQELLDGLGLDRQALMRDADDQKFAQALAAVEGREYRVKTVSKRGRDGDRWFTSTYILQSLSNGTAPAAELPVESTGLPEPGAATSNSGLFDDDDVPF